MNLVLFKATKKMLQLTISPWDPGAPAAPSAPRLPCQDDEKKKKFKFHDHKYLELCEEVMFDLQKSKLYIKFELTTTHNI